MLWDARVSEIRSLTLTICTFVLASVVSSCLTIAPAEAQTLKTVYAFKNPADGSQPNAGVIRDSAGILYGTTVQGGPSSAACVPLGCGEVFRVNPATGTKMLLHPFQNTDGARPVAQLLRDTAGNLYGTTSEGGSAGLGVAFKLDSSGTYTVLHNFTGGTDGGLPDAGLIHDAAGNLYGTTFNGGANSGGVVYRISATGNFKVLHSFTAGVEGQSSTAPLLRDNSGNLYGETLTGGLLAGTIFKLAPNGQVTVLYHFSGGSDGGNPSGGLVRDPAGNLYGTTPVAGDLTCSTPSGCGVVFKVDMVGNFTVLHTFTGSPDGAFPLGRMVLDTAGNLFGVTGAGGIDNRGTIYKLDTTGVYSVLHSFQTSMDDGYVPQGIVRDPAGNLYGATSGGPCCGTVFEFVP
jgi:uncharacterized repeat protein (TIGR03803 family)